ncbi:MAG: PEP-CTERM system histidine kinase PrsK [Rhodospirillaceae bacterium]|jgi:putative PEP-CTERM system histidine kinase|nr:PEP-CTERM system histidine kinase PrsK [Rhodospirillaceae bacterium]MBT5455864.1 PEP-CTERM system histidine kinase PrsK [Rhodospirillaceae bacterium]
MTFADIGFISYATSAFAFLVLMMLTLVSWRSGPVGAWLVAACAATMVWSLAAAYNFWSGHDLTTLVAVLEILRTAGWMAFLSAVLFFSPVSGGLTTHWRILTGSVAFICLTAVFCEISGKENVRNFLPGGFPDPALFTRLLLSVAGIMLVENLFRNSRREHRWGIKFLCFGAAGMFAYDFFMYSDALLFYRVNDDLDASRGVINALIVPLIALSARRNPQWSIDVFVSRHAIFHSATLIGAGVYLLSMAAVGFYLREFGGELGSVFQTVFLFFAIICMALVVFSGAFRARLKDIISQNFFSHKYDYRDEWLRFISTFSLTEGGLSLPRRVMEGIANIVESPESAVWAADGADRFNLLETWNMVAPKGVQSTDPSFVRFLEEEQTVINLSELASAPETYSDVVVPAWISDIPRAWLIVPLLHHERLHGFLLLAQPRAPRSVNREDYVLLATVGRQAASYLAERASARALAEAQQFDEFNRRFAFVLHDIKNLVSQLSLLVQNAEKHKNNPAFQDDMLETVEESVDKMNALLVRLHAGGKEVAVNAIVVLKPLLQKIVNSVAERNRKLTFETSLSGIAVVADEERLRAVIAHLIDNALEATTDGGRVAVRLLARGGDAILEVADNGTGMDEEFIRNELFRPFRTTKEGGFGIGVYESREFVRELGGRMEVVSARDQGTTIRVSLPAMQSANDADIGLRGIEVL